MHYKKPLLLPEQYNRPWRSANFHANPKDLPLNLRKKRTSLTGFENLRHFSPCSDFQTKKVVCRICEEEIQASLLKEHSKFCCIANTWDMIALESHDELHKVISDLYEKKLQSAIPLTNSLNNHYKYCERLHKGNIYYYYILCSNFISFLSVFDADLIDCIKLLVRQREQKNFYSTRNNRTITGNCKTKDYSTS